MSRNLRIYYYAVLGAMGGLVGWQLTDLIGYLNDPSIYLSDTVIGAILGLSIGGLIGLTEGILSSSLLRGLRSAIIGSGVGLLAGALAVPLGEFVFLSIGGGLMGRVVGWAIFGALIGLAVTLSGRIQVWKGVVGGLIGGAVGALLLEMALSYFRVPLIGKVAGLMLVGAAIGVFTALIIVTLSRAWIQVASGKLKGTEFLLDKFLGEKSPAAIIGSNVLKSDIALPDPSISPQHARLKGAGTHFTLQDMSVGVGTYVNGRKVEVHRLNDGETIRLGKTELVYHERR